LNTIHLIHENLLSSERSLPCDFSDVGSLVVNLDAGEGALGAFPSPPAGLVAENKTVKRTR